MEKTGWYFSVLPDGWTADKVIDAKDKKAVAVMTAGSLLIAAAVAVPLYFVGRKYTFEGFGEKILLYYLLFMAALFAYIVLHELTHGAVYKLMTRKTAAYLISGRIQALPMRKNTAFTAVLCFTGFRTERTPALILPILR